MDTPMVCSVLRNFAEAYTHNSEVEAKLRAGIEAGIKSSRADTSCRLAEMEKGLAAFREATGVNLLTDHGHPIWDIRGAGEAVKLLMALRKMPHEALSEAVQRLHEASAAIEQAEKIVRQMPEVPHA